MISNRIGTFLLLVGMLLIGLYVLSDLAKAPVCNYFVIGVILSGVGITLWIRNPAAPPPDSGRFRMLRSRKKQQNKGKK